MGEQSAEIHAGVDPRDPSTWPKWCGAVRPHPLTRNLRQRCMQVGPHAEHVWEDA